MPWKESSVMEERLQFNARLQEGQSMSFVCRSFGTPRRTDYKNYNRDKEHWACLSIVPLPVLI